MELKKNYGNNLSITFCKKKYVIGNNLNISLVISMSFIFTLITVIWILFLYKIFYKNIFFIGAFLYFLLLYYYLKCFFTEPGIIPRNYSKYIFKKEIKDNSIDSENNLFKLVDNRTKSSMTLDIEEPKINLEQINNEKKNKIFPDFILAESNEELKNNNMNLNNSINTDIIDNENIFNNNYNEKSVYIYSNKLKKIGENRIGDNITTKIKENKEDIISNNNSYIPHIFTKRPCNTCNIIRPPKTSHCVICDNCIMDFDHHCFYISNCIGIRNRKFFFLFLLYGFILSILFIITSSYHFIFILINDKYFYLTKILLKKYYIPISLSFILMLVGVLILFIKKESLKLSCCFFIFGNVLFDVFFYLNKKNKKQINFFEYHPFCLLLIYAVLPMLLFVIKYLKKQIKLIGKDLSMKQYMSIKEERNKNKNNKDVYQYLDSILKRKIKIKNIFYFLIKKQCKSLINV